MSGFIPYGSAPYGYAPLGTETQAFPAISGARKQTAIVAEAIQGSTPATPSFLIVRDIRVDGAIERTDSISRERRPDRATFALAKGLSIFSKTIEMPYVRDAATDVLWQSVFCNSFNTDVLRNGSAKVPFTLEERYGAAPSPVYRRVLGCIVDEMALSLRVGQVGLMRCKMRGLAETAVYDPIAGASYAVPGPGYDPVTSAEISVDNLFSLTSPRVVSLSLGFRNNVRERYGFGSVDPHGTGLGAFLVVGNIELYFTDLQEYARFTTRQSGLGLNLLIGSASGAQDQLQLTNVDVWNPNVDDPGAAEDHKVTLNFVAKYSSADAAVAVFTRNIT